MIITRCDLSSEKCTDVKGKMMVSFVERQRVIDRNDSFKIRYNEI